MPIGHLTNIALALRLEPRIAQNVKQIVLMGGNALVPGNSTPAAEANINDDPEAADIVFGTGWPVTMVGLDVTTKASMSDQQLQSYARSSSPMAQHIARPHDRPGNRIACSRNLPPTRVAPLGCSAFAHRRAGTTMAAEPSVGLTARRGLITCSLCQLRPL